MAKSKNSKQKHDSQHQLSSIYKLSSQCKKIRRAKKRVESSERKEWKDAVCFVCRESPHNAVLLLCSSYDNGCRPYMCATSYRHSNCLEQYMNAYGKPTPNQTTRFPTRPKQGMKVKLPEVLCPLCRGQVKGWTVLENARRYLNKKTRNCVQDNCSFSGNYKQLRKHVKTVHPLAQSRDHIDPSHVEKWKKLESERDLSDVYSIIRSTMPGAIISGDYVIERNYGIADGGERNYDFEDVGEREYNHSESRRDPPPGQKLGLLLPRRTGRLRGQ